MYFELLRLYRNYRNIESINIEIENSESIVFGHFDRISLNKSNTADKALDDLYNQYLPKSKELSTDVQPVILCSFDNKKVEHPDKFMAISFMQINKPLYCDTIKSFYEDTVKKINKIIKTLKSKKLIKHVSANVYIPLSFMNIAVTFYAENYTDICIVVKNIIHSGFARFQYSILSIPKKYDDLPEPEKRLIFHYDLFGKKTQTRRKLLNY